MSHNHKHCEKHNHCCDGHHHHHEHNKFELVKLIISFILFVLSFIIKREESFSQELREEFNKIQRRKESRDN